MKKIFSEIESWVKKNKGEVCFVGSFVVFDKKGDVKDDRIIGYGVRGAVEASLEGLEEQLKKDKEEFINW